MLELVHLFSLEVDFVHSEEIHSITGYQLGDLHATFSATILRLLIAMVPL